MQKTSMANEAVIRIRAIKKHLSAHKAKLSNSTYKKTITPFLNELSAIEEALYQVKNQSGQDPLNFPIKLNNRLASLRRSMENGEAKPTDGAYKVFEELSSELKSHMTDLESVMNKNLSKINLILKKAGVIPIEG
jgi:hypothetical protein